MGTDETGGAAGVGWGGDKDEGLAGEVGMTDRWGFHIVGP